MQEISRPGSVLMMLTCLHCGGGCRLSTVEPHARIAHAELYRYECTSCGQTREIALPADDKGADVGIR